MRVEKTKRNNIRDWRRTARPVLHKGAISSDSCLFLDLSPHSVQEHCWHVGNKALALIIIPVNHAKLKPNFDYVNDMDVLFIFTTVQTTCNYWGRMKGFDNIRCWQGVNLPSTFYLCHEALWTRTSYRLFSHSSWKHAVDHVEAAPRSA